MATIRILGVHGIGDHHTDTTWQDRWRSAIVEGLARWDRTLDIELAFFTYDELFAAHPITFLGSLEAVAKLLGSGVDNLLRRRRGFLDNVQNQLRWYAGMVVQWVENERLRKQLRQDLAAQMKAFAPDVICGHSLGSLVCYDAFTHPDSRQSAVGKTFVSLGSQLANPFVAGNFLAGRITPIEDCQWYHLFNEHDRAFTAPIRLSEPSFKQVATPFDIEGWADHDAVSYLAHSAAVAQVWSDLAGPTRVRSFLASSRQAVVRNQAAEPKAVRRALVVGINEYPDAKDRLEGCVNDAFLMSSVLQECGFAADDIRLVVDSRATTRGIRQRLNWLLNDAAPGDQLVFYYSGHGAQLPTYGAGDVVDRMDEALVPYDFDWSPQHAITDDQIYDLYAQLPYDVDLVMILDCCHSGGLTRGSAPRVRGLGPPDDIRHRALRWEAEHQMWVERSFRPLNRDIATTQSDQDLFVGESGATRRLGRAVDLRQLSRRHYDSLRKSRGHAGPYLPIVIQACREDQYSYEYQHGALSHGAFTFALAKNLRQSAVTGKTPTFQQLIRQTGKELGELGYAQEPIIIGPTSKLKAVVPWTAGAKTPRQRRASKPRAAPRKKTSRT